MREEGGGGRRERGGGGRERGGGGGGGRVRRTVPLEDTKHRGEDLYECLANKTLKN